MTVYYAYATPFLQTAAHADKVVLGHELSAEQPAHRSGLRNGHSGLVPAGDAYSYVGPAGASDSDEITSTR